MSHRFIKLLTLAAIAIFVAFPVAAAAQTQFALTVHDSVKILHGEQVVDLKVTITNLDVAPIYVRAVRFKNELPEGGTWYTALCFGDMCYPPDMDTPPAAHILAGDTALFKLTVGAEFMRTQSDTVRVAVRFDAGPLSDGVEQEFVVISSGVASSPDDAMTTQLAARPNPARTSTMIPLEPAELGASALRLQLVDALGRTVADMRDLAPSADGIRLDVRDVADGAYFYRVDADGVVRTGRIVVAH